MSSGRRHRCCIANDVDAHSVVLIPAFDEKHPVITDYAEDGGSKLLNNTGNYFLIDTESYTRRPQYEVNTWCNPKVPEI
jgi:hypothetical protein